jgi:hypothetical protein
MTPSPVVPARPVAATQDGPGAATASDRHTVPAPRPAPASDPTTRYPLPGVRARIAQPDAVVFTAPCPACGADCDWTEQREDTRLRTVVTCSCG